MASPRRNRSIPARKAAVCAVRTLPGALAAAALAGALLAVTVSGAAPSLGDIGHTLANMHVLAFAAQAGTPMDDETCLMCHSDPELESEDGRHMGVEEDALRAGVHGGFSCTDCHSAPGDYEDFPHYETYVPVDCSTCHEEAVKSFLLTPHGEALKRGEPRAPGCVDCHGLHGILSPSDTLSPVNPMNIPEMCGSCHGEEALITSDYVRLPVSLPRYLESVHDKKSKEGKRAAVCTDCHGAHDLRPACDPESSISRGLISDTCGKCHGKEAEEYDNSVHGKAVALGLRDPPTCTNCHNEHYIREATDPEARTSPEHQARELCGDCHTDPEIAAKYGITPGVVESYLDTYHGWTVGRGGGLVATCTDCHNVHDIGSTMDPSSSVHPDSVTATCGRCHEGSNPTFARSYSHESALQARGYHGWVRLIYIWIIAIVIGAMVLHNSVIAGHGLREHFRKRKREPYVVRWGKSERVQHWILLLSFTGLAITGFALRFPDAWWVKLIGLGGREVVRANLHRALAVVLIANSVYHICWLAVSRSARRSFRDVLPQLRDFREMPANLAYHLGLSRKKPAFGRFDYAQKTEYWSVFWGTFVMTVTGLVLWLPTIATRWLPAWTVRVAEVIHFYEAILAVLAVAVWHFFHVIFVPSRYPMSTVWIDGRMSSQEWKEHHRAAYEESRGSSIGRPDSERRDKARGGETRKRPAAGTAEKPDRAPDKSRTRGRGTRRRPRRGKRPKDR